MTGCERPDHQPVTELLIRPGMAADLPVLREVFRRASLSNSADVPALLAHPEALLLADAGLTEGRTRVATMADRVVGLATTQLGAGVLELADLFVDPNWMRRRIGRQLVCDWLTSAGDGHVERIDVTANPHAVAFHHAVGFVAHSDVATPFGFGKRTQLTAIPRAGAR